MIYVFTDEKTGMETYRRLEDKTMVQPSEGTTIKCYATLTDAIKDSYCWNNDHYSDGECLDYVMRAIAQLENN